MSAFIQKHTTPFPSLIDMRVSGLLCNGEISHEEYSFLNQNLLSISKCIILSWKAFSFRYNPFEKTRKLYHEGTRPKIESLFASYLSCLSTKASSCCLIDSSLFFSLTIHKCSHPLHSTIPIHCHLHVHYPMPSKRKFLLLSFAFPILSCHLFLG